MTNYIKFIMYLIIYLFPNLASAQQIKYIYGGWTISTKNDELLNKEYTDMISFESVSTLFNDKIEKSDKYNNELGIFRGNIHLFCHNNTKKLSTHYTASILSQNMEILIASKK